MQTRILDNRLYYTRKIELHRKGKKSRTVRITPILICLLAAKSLSTNNGEKSPLRWDGQGSHNTPPPSLLLHKSAVNIFFFFGSIINGSVNFLFLPDQRISGVDWGGSKSNMSKMVSIGPSSVCGTSLQSLKRRFCNWFWCLFCVFLGPSTIYTISPILFLIIPRSQQDVLFWYLLKWFFSPRLNLFFRR